MTPGLSSVLISFHAFTAGNAPATKKQIVEHCLECGFISKSSAEALLLRDDATVALILCLL